MQRFREDELPAHVQAELQRLQEDVSSCSDVGEVVDLVMNYNWEACHPQVFHSTMRSLCGFLLRRISWSRDDRNEHVDGMARLFRLSDRSVTVAGQEVNLFDGHVLSALLMNDTFLAPFLPTLQCLSHVLCMPNGALKPGISPGETEAVCTWLQRLIGVDDASAPFHSRIYASVRYLNRNFTTADVLDVPEYQDLFRFLAGSYFQTLRVSSEQDNTLKYIGTMSMSMTYPVLSQSIPVVVNSVVATLRDAITLVPAEDLLTAMFPHGKNTSRSHQAMLEPLQHLVMEEVVGYAIRLLFEATFGFASPSVMEKYVASNPEDGLTMTFKSMLDTAGSAWCHFLAWYDAHTFVDPDTVTLSFCDDRARTLNRMAEVFKVAKRLCSEAAEIVSAEVTCTRDYLVSYSTVPMPELEAAFAVVTADAIADSAAILLAEMDEAEQTLTTLSAACNKLKWWSVRDRLKASLVALEDFNVGQCRLLMSWGEKRDETSLPSVLLKQKDWLTVGSGCPLFVAIASDEGRAIDADDRVTNLAARWRNLYASVRDRSARFGDLSKFSFHLWDRSAAHALCALSEAVPSGPAAWPVREPDEAELAETEGVLAAWVRLEALRAAREDTYDIMTYVQDCISPYALEAFNSYQQAFNALTTKLDAVKWEDLTMADLPSFQEVANAIPDIFLKIRPDLLEAASDAEDLLAWLRELPDDADFVSGLEIAMGRPQLSCPPSLWRAGKGGEVGCPDERILSMLRSIRAHLYPLIYRPLLRTDNLEEVLVLFAEIAPSSEETRATVEGIIAGLNACQPLWEDLRELLSGGAEDAAVGRLELLQTTSKQTTWTCGTIALDAFDETKAISVGSVRVLFGQPVPISGARPTEVMLQFIAAGGSEGQFASESLAELQEFHSSLVLSSDAGEVVAGASDERNARSIAISRFSRQFSAFSLLCTVTKELQDLGHFCFRSFLCTLGVNDDPDCVFELVASYRHLATAWSDHITEMRNGASSQWANHFSIHQLWKFADALDGFAEEDSRKELAQLLHFYDPSAAVDKETVLSFCSMARKAWEEFEHVVTDDMHDLSVHRLRACLHVVETCFPSVTRRLRPVTLPSAAEYDPADNAALYAPGVHLVSADAEATCGFEYLLTAFLGAGRLPERELVLVCTQSTVLDDLLSFVARWSASEGTSASDLFCIVGVERLSLELQYRLVESLRARLNGVRAPLVAIIEGGGESSHFAAEFTLNKISIVPMPRAVIRDVVGSALLSSSLPGGATLYSSIQPGAGKSFQIRKRAFEGYYGYIHVPVFSSSALLRRLEGGPRSLLSYAERLEGQGAVSLSGLEHCIGDTDLGACDDFPLLFHLDLTDTAASKSSGTIGMNDLLFQLVFFGGVCHGDRYTYAPLPVMAEALALEAPAGLLAERLPVLSFLPVREISVTPQMFTVSENELEMGMAAHEYEPLFVPSSSTRKTKQQLRAMEGNAFERLMYVSATLEILDDTQGRYPYTHEVTDRKKDGSLRSSLRSSISSLELSSSLDGSRSALSSGGGSAYAARVFNLLVDATDQNAQYPSLWCIWNFVNILFRQLRELNAADSVINHICQPEKGDDKARVAFKEIVKGDIIRCLIATAKDISTRQIKEFDTRASERWQAVVVKVGPHERSDDLNNVFIRTDYDHDGQPCFTTGDLFLYYRASSKSWVIDESIGESPCMLTAIGGTKLPAVGSWTNRRPVNVGVAEPNGSGGMTLSIHNTNGPLKSRDSGVYLHEGSFGGHDLYKREAHGRVRYILYDNRLGRWVVTDGVSCARKVFAQESISGPNLQFKSLVAHGNANITAKCLTMAEFRTIPLWKLTVVKLCAPAQHIKDINDLIALVESDPSKLFSDMVKWNDSPHHSLVFSNATQDLRFLTMKPTEMKQSMHPYLLQHVEDNGFDVGGGVNSQGERSHYVTLSKLTGIHRSAAEAKALLGGSFCLTGDCLMKLLALHTRIRSGLPVVLMGECGCGKTHLINYLCAWLDAQLLVLDIHGGTTEEDIVHTFAKACDKAMGDKSTEVFVLLDEVNTCAHMGLLNELICHRNLFGMPLPSNIRILAALNPYRKRSESSGGVPGLVFKLHDGDEPSVEPNAMAELVYKVHPIPLAMLDFLFDFGSIEPVQEKSYIGSMIAGILPDSIASEAECSLISELVNISQRFVRQVEKDESAVSLRDVKRCARLICWFAKKATPAQRSRKVVEKPYGRNPRARSARRRAEDMEPICGLAGAVTIGLAFVYCYRLTSASARERYWEALKDKNRVTGWTDIGCEGFERLSLDGMFEKVLSSVQKSFTKHFSLPKGIALNAALMENLFITVICMLNRIPVFIVGKPGSSKTLTMQIIASNLQGSQSESDFWKKFPAVYVFQYQCSPLSDSGSIQHQFEVASRYQKHAENCITTLLLDEVGLAEHSPDMPLKVLHGMLVDPPIAIVGLSNWVLDPAKMNRAICVQRMDPSKHDITRTGGSILAASGSTSFIKKAAMTALSRAYHDVYTNQKGARAFIGMRDYYSLVKALDAAASRTRAKNTGFTAEQLVQIVCRNFGGKKKQLVHVLEVFLAACFPKLEELPATPSVVSLISMNLKDDSARNMMILNQSINGIGLLLGFGVLPSASRVLQASDFPQDRTEFYLVQQIREVKQAMARGETLVLVNHDNIYEALYDVLNQRYLYRSDPNNPGKTKRMLRLAIGSKSQLCPVEDGFKIIVVVEKRHALENLDLPLLNRFEKQALKASDLLSDKQQELASVVQAWVADVVAECSWCANASDVFSGYYEDTVASAVLTFTGFRDESLEDEDGVMATAEAVRKAVGRLARPSAVIHSPLLRETVGDGYFKDHASIASVLLSVKTAVGNMEVGDTHTLAEATPQPDLQVLLTDSPVAHFDRSFPATLGMESTTVALADFPTEVMFKAVVADFYQPGSGPTLLVVQFDPSKATPSLMLQAQQICLAYRCSYKNVSAANEACPARTTLFIVHLPPSTRKNQRSMKVDLMPPWTYTFLDDVRSSRSNGELLSLVSSPVRSLLEDPTLPSLNLARLLKDRYQFSFSRCNATAAPDGSTAGNRLTNLQQFVTDERCLPFVQQWVSAMLEACIHDQEGVPYQLELVTKHRALQTGTFRQNLHRAVELVVEVAFAVILLRLDTNLNLLIAQSAGGPQDDVRSALWWHLLTSADIMDTAKINMVTKLDYDVLTSDMEMLSVASLAPFAARFPFSWRVATTLQSSETRDLIMLQSVAASMDSSVRSHVSGDELVERAGRLHGACSGIFGQEVTSQWDALAGDYLHDFVYMTAKPFPNVTHATMLRLYRSIGDLLGGSLLSSVAGIHVMYWHMEDVLSAMSSLLSAMTGRQQEEALDSMAGIAKMGGEESYMIGSLFATTLHVLFSSQWQALLSFRHLPEAEEGMAYLRWVNQLPRFVSPVFRLYNEAKKVFTDVHEPIPGIQGATVSMESLRKDWARLLVVKIFLEMAILHPSDFVDSVTVNPGAANAMSLLKDCDPLCLEGFASLLAAAASWLPDSQVGALGKQGELEQLFNDLMQGLIRVVLFPPKDKLAAGTLPLPLLSALAAVADGVPGPLQDFGVNLASRRLLIQHLCALPDFAWRPSTPSGMFLYLQYVEDRLLQEMSVGVEEADLSAILAPMSDEELAAASPAALSAFYEKFLRCKKFLESNFSSPALLNSSQACLPAECVRLTAGTSDMATAAKAFALLAALGAHGYAGLLELLGPDGPLQYLSDSGQVLQSDVEDIFWRLPGGSQLDYEEALGSVIGFRIPMTFDHLADQAKGGSQLWAAVAARAFIIGQLDEDNEAGGFYKEGSYWVKQQDTLVHAEASVYNWLLRGCPLPDGAQEAVPAARLPRGRQLMRQVTIYAVLAGLIAGPHQGDSNWLWSLLSRTEFMDAALLPAVCDTGMADAISGMGHVGWYKCSNGHLYSVGECTMPMQVARCPECGVPIGGRQHQSVRGVKRVQPDGMMMAGLTKGYPKAEITNDKDVTAVRDLPPVAVALARFLIHSELEVGLHLTKTLRENIVAHLAVPMEEGMSKAASTAAYLSTKTYRYWLDLLRLSHLPPDELVQAVILCIDSVAFLGGSLVSLEDRRSVENGLEQAARRFLTPPYRGLKNSRSKAVDVNVAACKVVLGEETWGQLMAAQARQSLVATASPPSVLLGNWLKRQPSSYAHFASSLSERSDEEDLQLMQLAIGHEADLTIVRHLASILAWHRILFRALGHVRLTREAASSLTNEELIRAHVPPAQQEAALRVLDSFCEGFNEAFVQVHFLYECNANPFLDADGQVNLTGGQAGGRMSRDTPVTFSLPSVTQGDVDAAGLCTIQLLTHLQNTQNRLLDEAQAVRFGRFRDISSTAKGLTSDSTEVATVNFNTPTEHVEQLLISYDRERDLLPLIFAHQRVTEYGHLSYDFASIEASLGHALLSSKQQLAVHIHHFQYAGELKRRGKLGSLRLRVTQRPLPPPVKESILKDVDTQHHAAQLMALVEVCINFVVSVGGAEGGGSSVDGTLLMEEYLLTCLLVDASEWQALTTVNISKQVRLMHLQSLTTCLEEILHGSTLDAVDSAYCQELPAKQSDNLKAAKPMLDLSLLLPTFHDLLTDQLCVGAKFAATDSLKQYLAYANFDLEEEEWYGLYFPASLSLAHARAAYELLSAA